MSIQAGLFQLGMIDYHAILGFSLSAEPSQVRRRYLQIARQLHPDSLHEATEAQRQLASQLLSKRVNPAYEVLSKGKPLREHQFLLKMKQQQLIGAPDLVSFNSDRARKLLDSNPLEAEYAAAIKQIASTQFDTLDLVESVIGELSELNAVYLIRTGTLNKGTQKAPIASKLATTESTTAGSAVSSTRVRPMSGQARTSIIDSYIRRAKEFEAQRDYSRGILELREAIGSHPKSAPCHAYLSNLYLRSGQATMAGIHAKQALAIEPENQTAQTVQDKLSASKHPISRKQTASRKGNADVKAQSKGTKKGTKKGKQGGGLLLGLFGGKKK